MSIENYNIIIFKNQLKYKKFKNNKLEFIFAIQTLKYEEYST